MKQPISRTTHEAICLRYGSYAIRPIGTYGCIGAVFVKARTETEAFQKATELRARPGLEAFQSPAYLASIAFVA